jgi:large subunit ribosomal protein L33
MARPSDEPASAGSPSLPGKISIMAKSDKRPIIKLKSTAGTGYTYVTRKNKTNTRERIELMKYDPRIRKHVIFKEER